MPDVDELFDDRGGGLSAGGKGNEGVQRRWTRRFRVMMDAWNDSPPMVLLLEGIPRIGDPYISGGITDLGARCHDLDPQSTEIPRQYIVTASYSSDQNDIGDPLKETGGAETRPDGTARPGSESDPNSPTSQESNDPLERPAEIEWGEEQFTEVVTRADRVNAAGDVVEQNVGLTSSAGEEFDPPLTVEKTRLTLTVTRNQKSFDQVTAALYNDTLNSDTFFGYGAGKVRCRSITASSQYENGRTFYRVRYLFHIRHPEGWDYRILDRGYWEIVGGNRTEIALANGRPISAPWPLDGNGTKLTVAQVQAGNAFVHRIYRVFTKRAFSVLSLP